MKPFNLEQFKAGKPAVTRDGCPARYLGTLEGGTGCIVVAIKYLGAENAGTYNTVGKRLPDGTYYSDKIASARDLFMAPEKKEGWIVMSSNSLHDASNVVTREQAEKIAAASQKRYSDPDGHWKVVHITWEE